MGSLFCRSCGHENLDSNLECAACGGALEPYSSLTKSLLTEAAAADTYATPETLPIPSWSAGQPLGERYEVRRILGRGGMGEVWLALDHKLRVEIALKLLHPKLSEDQRSLELLRREVRTAREVVSPNVCRIFDLVEIHGRELVSMEYIDGSTLTQLLASRGPLELREAGELAAQMLSGLEAIHRAGLVHRDLKPENVMITHAGRVVVMDFGLAWHPTDAAPGSVAGTPAYMSPEQLRGEALDASSDVYAAGIILAEMLERERPWDFAARKALWSAAREQPPRLSPSPWRPVLLKALAADRKQRFASAQALARALEEVALRVEGAEGKRPYPGLAAYTEAEAELFFGREAEVEALWAKLRRQELLALIGPSGAGKSSFLRAGLLAARPEGWNAVLCHPGREPFVALGQALVAGLAGDTEALRQLLRFEELDVALDLLRRWRAGHAETLLVVDQFEELFALCPPQVQDRFAELLGRAARETGVHVLVAMRDDFLFRCSAHPALAPVYTDLTPLRPPSGEAMRRALVQPALSCGYRFEDEALVQEMLAEVGQERSALPLVAFAAARLWEERDRDTGLLTWAAYRRIGGVGGALAQHAEGTLHRIGMEREPVVCELFRNLVTAQGTRMALDREELLSVFGPGRAAAEPVLDALIGARLLTTYEAADEPLDAALESRPPRRSVELIHESLLLSWPRLVRWRTQQADGALLRDQLRQAAQAWEARARPAGLLWTGAVFREFQLWRERYPGGLSATEEAFCRAMFAQAAQRGRRRRLGLVAAFTALVLVLALMTALYRSSEAARDQADEGRRKSEASRLLALGRLKLETFPSEAVAYALASLEIADDPLVRRFALEALWQGPTALVASSGDNAGWSATFSPDGKWLAAGTARGIELWQNDGSAPKLLPGGYELPAFTPDGRRLVAHDPRDGDTLWIWSVPDGSLIRKLSLDASAFVLHPNGKEVLTIASKEGVLVEAWPIDGGAPRKVAQLSGNSEGPLAIDPEGRWLAIGNGPEVGLLRLDGQEPGRWLPLGRHDKLVTAVAFDAKGARVASGDKQGEIRIWSTSSVADPERVLLGHRGDITRLAFDSSGTWLASAGSDQTARLWDLTMGAVADPIVLHVETEGVMRDLAFDPSGRWLVTAAGDDICIWPLAKRYPRVLRGHTDASWGVAFDPAGNWLASTSWDGSLRLWPLWSAPKERARVLFELQGSRLWDLAVDAQGQTLLVAAQTDAWLTSLADGSTRALPGPGPLFGIRSVAFGRDGRKVACAYHSERGESVIRLSDLGSELLRTLDPDDGEPIYRMAFTAGDQELAAAGEGGLRLYRLADGSSTRLQDDAILDVQSSADGRRLLSAFDDGVILHSLEAGTKTTLEAHTASDQAVAFDPEGRLLASANDEGIVLVGPISGQEAHLLLGHRSAVKRLAFHPAGEWLASSSTDGTVRLWPVPLGPPFHTLPYAELLDRLRSLTNYRVVPDASEPSGYQVELAPFPGWQRLPLW